MMLMGLGRSILFFKQKTAYEMRISDWSSDVCSSDLHGQRRAQSQFERNRPQQHSQRKHAQRQIELAHDRSPGAGKRRSEQTHSKKQPEFVGIAPRAKQRHHAGAQFGRGKQRQATHARSEEHTSELQSLMRISYAVFCLKKKKKQKTKTQQHGELRMHKIIRQM